MDYRRDNVSNIFLYDTKIENIFINEYMSLAPGEYVKVYLMGCMFAESNMPIDNDVLARQLNISVAEIEKAWKFWEDSGVVKRRKAEVKKSKDEIVIMNLKEIMFGSPSASEENKKLINVATERIYATIERAWGQILDVNELRQIAEWQEFYNVTEDLIVFGIKYCAEREKKSVKYLEKVIQGWCEHKLTTEKEVQHYLEEMDQKYYKYRRVLTALGFTRNATEAEKDMMDAWFDEMKFTVEKVLEACKKTSGISNPNLNYVNAVLKNWYKEANNMGTDVNKKSVTNRATLNEYLQYLRTKEENEAKDRQQEVYEKIPKIKNIDNEISSLGADMSKAILSGNVLEGKRIKATMDSLVAERAIILTENNFEVDYTDIRYSCSVCRDTGITDEGEKCNCIKQRIEEAGIWQKVEK